MEEENGRSYSKDMEDEIVKTWRKRKERLAEERLKTRKTVGGREIINCESMYDLVYTHSQL